MDSKTVNAEHITPQEWDAVREFLSGFFLSQAGGFTPPPDVETECAERAGNKSMTMSQDGKGVAPRVGA